MRGSVHLVVFMLVYLLRETVFYSLQLSDTPVISGRDLLMILVRLFVGSPNLAGMAAHVLPSFKGMSRGLYGIMCFYLFGPPCVSQWCVGGMRDHFTISIQFNFNFAVRCHQFNRACQRADLLRLVFWQSDWYTCWLQKCYRWIWSEVAYVQCPSDWSQPSHIRLEL